MVFERRLTESRNERYGTLATELVNLKVDLIVAPGAPAVVAAKEATSTIPIVTVLVSDLVGSRLIASLARPGGNVTGMSSSARDITAKGLELLKEIAPRLSRVAVIWNATSSSHMLSLKELEAAARTLRVRLQPIDVRTPTDIESAFVRITKERADALINAFEQGLRELDYVIGQNVMVEYRFAEGRVDRVPALLDEVLRVGVDVVLAGNPFVIRAARQATGSVPIVGIDLETDPLAAGWVKSLARPGGNLTGFFLSACSRSSQPRAG